MERFPATRRKLMRVLRQLARRGELSPTRDRSAGHRQEELTTLGLEGNFGGEFVRTSGVKRGFMDGSLGSSTRRRCSTTTPSTPTSGFTSTEPPRINELING
jgi:predicted amidohydrolase YtcJ